MASSRSIHRIQSRRVRASRRTGEWSRRARRLSAFCRPSRAAHSRSLYRRNKRRTSDHFCFGVVAASWHASWHRAASRGRVSRSSGPGSGVSISVVTAERRRTTSSPVVGGFRIRLASSARPLALFEQRRAVAVSVANGWPCFLRRPGLFGTFVLVSTAVLSVSVIRHRRSAAAAPLCGLLTRPCCRGRSGWRRAHSSGGITSGCTRRRRANIAHMQAPANRRCRSNHLGLEPHHGRLHFGHRRASNARSVARLTVA